MILIRIREKSCLEILLCACSNTISVDKVLEQAQSYGHSPKREFAFLIVHSMLHLFGYDHIDPKDAAIMEPKQKQILEEMHIVRD